jgi:predicted regulator of Ras-like GTPase activity (Roadblock/LC7/MglB family)
MFRVVDAAQALADLTEISSQIDAAAVADDQGNVIAATSVDGEALGGAGRALLELAAKAQGGREPVQLDASTARGSVFVVRDGDRTIVAATAPQATAGLVFYDLKTCLGALESQRPKRRRAKKKQSGDA